MKQLLTKEDVAKAIADLEKQGKKVTCASLHAALGNRGSMSTMLKLKNELEGNLRPAIDSPEGLKTFHQVWALAVAEGRQLQEATVAQLREDLKALATENERLDGRAIELEHAEEVAKSEMALALEELKAMQSDMVNAADETKRVLSTLAEERANHARELTGLRQELAGETRKKHELELALARVQGAETTTIGTTPGKALKRKHTPTTNKGEPVAVDTEPQLPFSAQQP